MFYQNNQGTSWAADPTLQLSAIIEKISENLGITEKQHEDIVNRYKAVGRCLADESSILKPFDPHVLPQGSFLIGTMIKPVNEGDEIDFDLVCLLAGKNHGWTQAKLKEIVGECLKNDKTYNAMLRKEGNRCWTLGYADASKFHMDVLPAIAPFVNFELHWRSAFLNLNLDNPASLAIRITDRRHPLFYTSYNLSDFPSSNPFGYAYWFKIRATINRSVPEGFRAHVHDAPAYQKQDEKLPLQIAIQILKRHRDIVFGCDEDKPISIIITTLAAKAYQKETDVLAALDTILANMDSPAFIQEVYDPMRRRRIKVIENPVDKTENFADKWILYTQRQEKFYWWLEKAREDFRTLKQQRGADVQKSLEGMFGKAPVSAAFTGLANQIRTLRERGDLYITPQTGMLATTGIKVPNHHFYGGKPK